MIHHKYVEQSSLLLPFLEFFFGRFIVGPCHYHWNAKM